MALTSADIDASLDLLRRLEVKLIPLLDAIQRALDGNDDDAMDGDGALSVRQIPQSPFSAEMGWNAEAQK